MTGSRSFFAVGYIYCLKTNVFFFIICESISTNFILYIFTLASRRPQWTMKGIFPQDAKRDKNRFDHRMRDDLEEDYYGI